MQKCWQGVEKAVKERTGGRKRFKVFVDVGCGEIPEKRAQVSQWGVMVK